MHLRTNGFFSLLAGLIAAAICFHPGSASAQRQRPTTAPTVTTTDPAWYRPAGAQIPATPTPTICDGTPPPGGVYHVETWTRFDPRNTHHTELLALAARTHSIDPTQAQTAVVEALIRASADQTFTGPWDNFYAVYAYREGYFAHNAVCTTETHGTSTAHMPASTSWSTARRVRERIYITRLSERLPVGRMSYASTMPIMLPIAPPTIAFSEACTRQEDLFTYGGLGNNNPVN